MHRFIVFQYGKVGSTSLVSALNSVEGLEAHQSHFLGKAAFSGILDRLMNPGISDSLFYHSSEQLIQNLQTYRHFLLRGQGTDKLTIVTLSREPFSWFKSAIGQDIRAHLQTFRKTLTKLGMPCGSDEQAILQGCTLLLSRIAQAISLIGGIDRMSEEERLKLFDRMDFADEEDFYDFLFLLGNFLEPHFWFSAHFSAAMDTCIQEFEPIAESAYRKLFDWGNIYLIRYEELESGFGAMVADLGIEGVPPLGRENTGTGKMYREQLSVAFDSEEGQLVRELSTSRDSRFLGYH